MRILLISDIHGNYPALMAIERRFTPGDFDAILNCGDSLVYAPFPNETLNWLRANKVVSILGNTDKKVIKLLKGKTFGKPSKAEKKIMYSSTAEDLSPKNIKYLKSLKKTARIRLQVNKTENKSGPTLLGMFHGSPAAHHEFLFDSTPENRFAELAATINMDIVVTGHSHTPYHKKVSGIDFINPGSVGRMFDGEPTASFAILNTSEYGLEVRFYRIPYTVAEVVTQLRDRNLPEIYCEMYQTGRKLN